MTWRAFLIGLLGVVGLALLTPVNDYALGNTYLTGNHFPVGVFFLFLCLTLGLNVVIKLVGRVLDRRWALRRAELLLVFAMMLVSATVPASGLMRYWFPISASVPYLAQRSDIYWEDTVLPAAPEGILLTKDPHSFAVRKFFRGTREGEPVRVPWRAWTRNFGTWGTFLLLYYLATFFLCAILRRQWVEHERLMFPVARVPLDLTEGSGESHLLPDIFRNRVFLVGVLMSVLFGLVRICPVFFGAEEGWSPSIPISPVLEGTPLAQLNISDARIYPLAIGIAFLVPSEVSLSMWFFYLLTCAENQAFYSFGIPIEGGTANFLGSQQAGAFLAFTAVTVFMGRRHLWAVFRKATGIGEPVDDADEPVGYRLCFWGLIACAAGMVGWYWYFGVRPFVGTLLVVLGFSIVLVHARLVSQGGVILTGQSWSPSSFLHDMTGGTLLTPTGAVVAQTQHALFLADAREILSPHAMNSLRISSVFERHRRLFLPIMMVALLAAVLASGYSILRWVYYSEGAQNLANQYSVTWHPRIHVGRAHQMISDRYGSAHPHYTAVIVGAGVMTGLQLLRGAFYWWPINPLGLLISASWHIRPFWFCFLLGWLSKVVLLKLATGRALRPARHFWMGVIAGEITLVGGSTLFTLLTDVRIGYLFMPS